MEKKTYNFTGKLQQNRQELVNKIIDNMEKGFVLLPPEWTKTRPYNPVSNIHYKAGNVLRLMTASMYSKFTDPRWCTYKQAEKMGWNVKKGAKGVLLEKWIFTEEKIVEDEKTGEKKKEIVCLEKPKCNFFYVFNAEQIHGIPELNISEKKWEQDEYLDIADKMILASECPIIEQGNEAFYRISEDKIFLPPRGCFINTESFLATMLHEMAHSTGAAHRLGRSMANPFGSENYAREELRAEIASAFIQSDIGLPPTAERFQNNSNYLLSWIKVLQDDPNELFRACKDAEKATEYIIKKYTQLPVHSPAKSIPDYYSQKNDSPLREADTNAAPEKSLSSETRRIALELRKLGCTPNKGLIKNINELQAQTGQAYTAEKLEKLNPSSFSDSGNKKLAIYIHNQIQALIPLPG